MEEKRIQKCDVSYKNSGSMFFTYLERNHSLLHRKLVIFHLPALVCVATYKAVQMSIRKGMTSSSKDELFLFVYLSNIRKSKFYVGRE